MSAVYSSGQSASSLATSYKAVPLRRDLEFVRSDHMEDGPFFWPNKVYTPERPLDADDLPMYHSSETVPVGVEASPTELIAAWERKNWPEPASAAALAARGVRSVRLAGADRRRRRAVSDHRVDLRLILSRASRNR